MTTVFHLANSIAMPTVEILLISPFKDIWERDVSPSKFYAMKEFTYIEFMASPRKTNPFYGYSDLVERSQKIRQVLYSTEEVHKSVADKWQPDALVKKAIEFYCNNVREASPSMRLLEAAEAATASLQDFLHDETILTKLTPKGLPMYKPADIIRAVQQTEGLLKSLHALREKVEQELYDNGKTMNNRKIGMFEEVS